MFTPNAFVLEQVCFRVINMFACLNVWDIFEASTSTKCLGSYKWHKKKSWGTAAISTKGASCMIVPGESWWNEAGCPQRAYSLEN